MKKIIILIVAIFTINIANAQQYHPFPDSNAVWSEIYTVNSPHSFTRFQYGMFGDTILNNTVYHKIYERLGGYPYDTMSPANSTLFGAMREDSLKCVFCILFQISLYFCPSETIFKLYDFSKQVGDTIVLDTTIQLSCYPFKYMVVDSIDSVFTYNSYRKRFHLDHDTWIEGIGSIRSLYSSILGYPTCLCWNESICFTQNDTTIYINPYYDNCYPNSSNNVPPGGIPEYLKTELKIYPSPTKDNLIIETNLNTEQRIEILNLIGQTIYTSYINKKATVNTSAFPSGVYILKLYTDKETIVKKFLKE